MHQTWRKILAGSLALFLALTGVEFGQVASALAAIELPSSLECIEDEAFMGDALLAGRIDVPEDVTLVGENAFAQSGVYAMVFPERVAQIGSGALSGTGASYALVYNADAAIANGAFTGLSYLFGHAGSTAQTYAAAEGIAFVALDALAEDNGFFYEVGDTATLLCALDATQVSGDCVISETVGGKKVALIKAQAFAGCGALETLQIPYGVTVESGAYDPLPDTVITQAQPSLEITKITCSITESVYAGQKPMWAVRAQGGEGVVRYRFELMQDGAVIAQQDYAAKNYFSYTLTEPGSYIVNVTCTDDAQNTCTASSEAIRVLAEPLEILSVTGDVSLGVVGEAINWTVETQNGSAPVQYSYTVLRDGIAVETLDFAQEASCSYVPEKTGYYVLDVTCLDADATIVQKQSDIVTVISQEEAKPAAPALIFADSALAFAADEASAPSYGGQSITTSWEAVEYASFYSVTLDRQENGEWVNIHSEESLSACSARLDATLFADVTERTMYRFGIASQGIRAGDVSYSYFAVEKIEVDESLLINGAASITWDQAHCYESIRGFEVTSQLPWTAQASAQWLECTTLDDGTLCVKMRAQEEIAERTATVTVTNGVNTAIIHVCQGTTQTPMTLLLPALSTDASAPTRMPVGEFALEWDDQGHDYGLLRVYELYSGGGMRKIYGAYMTKDYWYATTANLGEALKAGSTYMIELTGFYSSSCKANEVEADALRQRYYLTATEDGHSMLVNGESALTLSNITAENVFASASNFFTCTTDADWLTASISLKNSAESAVKIRATVNDTASTREGYVTLTCGTAQAVVTVRQESMLPQLLKPAGVSQNESSPTTLYADLNRLNTSYEFFLYRGLELTIAQGSAGTYGDEIEVDSSSTFGEYYAKLGTDEISGGRYRITVSNGDLVSYYYVKFADNDEEPYDDIIVDGNIMRKKIIGATAQTMTVPLEANASWKASSDASWLTLSKSSGSTGSYTISVTAAENTTGAARTGIVTFASTATECEGWLVVKQSAQDYMEVYYDGDFGYETYDASKHTAMMEGAAGRTNSFIVYSSLDYDVVSNASWLTLSASGATSLNNETGETFQIYMARNDTGAPRTGSVTVKCGSLLRSISITQAPALGELTLVSPTISQDYKNPSIIQHEDLTITWNSVTNAVSYCVFTDYSGNQEKNIAADGSAQYTITIPKSWMQAYSEEYQTLYVYAYDQYGFINKEWYYFQAVTGDAALVNGEAKPEWLNADDVATSKDFVIQSSQDWTVAASASWMTLSAASGASGDTLTVSLSENTGAARTGMVTITVGSASTVIDISQCAYLAQEKPVLSSPALSVEKTSPTQIAAGSSMTFTWTKEPQAWHYSLSIAEFTSDTASKTIAKSGTLRTGAHTFTDLELTEGALYKVTLERFSARYKYTRSVYYMTVSPEEAWVLADGLDAYAAEMDGSEDHDYLEITASGYWSATTQDDWILLSDTPVHQADLDEDGLTAAHYSSYGNVSGENLCISVLANPDSQPRTGTVTLTSGSASMDIPVKQYQNYQIAQLASPALSTASSEMPKIKYGGVTLRWSGAQGGTGEYEITVYESESQRTGYYQIYEATGLASTSHTIPVSKLTEGLYYRVWLGTELADGDYAGASYYFQLGYEDELTATVSVAGSEATVGQHLGVTVQASGGAGGYKYAYKLMQGETVVEETAYENIAYYSFVPTQAGDYYIRVYVRDANGDVVVIDSADFSAEDAPDAISISRSVWAAGADAESIAVTVNADAAWTAAASADWISVSVSGDTATVSLSANANTVSRSGSVTFTSGSASATLSIAQEALATDETAAIALSMGVWNITDVTGAAVANLTVTCDGAWAAANVPEWISMTALSGTGTTAIQLYAAANVSDARSGQIDFTCGTQTVSLLVAQAGNELAPRVTAVSVTDDAPLTGEEVTFNITAVNADTVIFTVDGTPYEQLYVSDGKASYTRAFSQGGVREVTFVPVRGSVIGAASTAIEMNVGSYGDLNTPTITCETEAELGESVSVSWNAIAHADHYVINVWRDDVLLATETGFTDTAYDLTYEILSCEGTYTFHIMAVGAGYSQSESAEFITVSLPSTSAKLTAPGAGDVFDIGNTLGLQASNPEGRPLTLHLYKGGEQIAVFPAEGTISALNPYYEYILTEAGTYQANLSVYGAAGNVIAQSVKVSFSVSGPTIESGTYVGTGARTMYTDQAASFRVVTNTAVETVSVAAGEKTYTGTGGAINTGNWTRTFTGTMDVPSEGKHTAVVTAADAYGHAATRTLTYYAVTRDENGTKVYPQKNGVSVKSAPDAAAASATMAPSDTATLLGSCGEYRYVDFGGVKGFVHQDEIGSARLTVWDGLDVAIPLLANKDIPGCILMEDTVSIYWTSSVALPASAAYRLSLVDESGAVTQLYQGAYSAYGLAMNSLGAGKYTVRVEIVSADNEVTYLTRDSAHRLDMKDSYNGFFAATDPELFELEYSDVMADQINLANLYRFFTIGYTSSTGERCKADLSKLTENAVMSAYQKYFGDTLTAMGEKHLRRVSIAEAIMDEAAEKYVRTTEIDCGMFKRCLQMMGVPLDVAAEISAAQDMGSKLKSTDYEALKAEFDDLVEKHSLDSYGLIEGLEKGVTIGTVLTTIWAKYVKYSCVDHDEVDTIIAQLRSTGDEELLGVSDYLEALNDEESLMMYLVLGHGGKAAMDACIDVSKNTLEELIKCGISKLPGGFAFTIGTSIGKAIGVSVNNFVFNVDEIQNKACELKWRIDATEAYYELYMKTYSAYLSDPVGGYKAFAEASIAFEQMVTIIYQGWADFCKASDEAGWSKFVDFICFWAEDAQVSTNAQHHADSLPATALQNLGTSLDYFYYDFLITQGVEHVKMPSIWSQISQ